MAQMLIRVTKEMNKALKRLDNPKMIEKALNDAAWLLEMQYLEDTILTGVYRQWKDKMVEKTNDKQSTRA